MTEEGVSTIEFPLMLNMLMYSCAELHVSLRTPKARALVHAVRKMHRCRAFESWQLCW